MNEIICINDKTISGNKYAYITLGKHYISYPDNQHLTARADDSHAAPSFAAHRFYITNDAGSSCNYPLRNFMVVDEWRNKQLDKLVDENIEC